MCLRALKNYSKYLKKIELYAKAIGIKIEYKTEYDDGAYIPSKRKIRLDPDLSPTRDIAVLLHELGHALDDHLINKKYSIAINAAYRALENDRQTMNQRALILECEYRAWRYAKVLAKKLQIPLGSWFFSVKNEYLKEYRRNT